jgi:hypothetical protein
MQNRALPGRGRGGAARPYDFTGQNFAPQPLAHPLAHPLCVGGAPPGLPGWFLDDQLVHPKTR